MDIMSYLLGQTGAVRKGLRVEVVEELPTTGESNVLYLVPKDNTGESDVFEEWIYINNNWEKIGSTDIDLSNYYTKDETIAKLTSMPTASADYLGTVVMYIGQTVANSYTNGHFYICVSDGEQTPTYSWVELTVQNLVNYYTKTEVDATTGNLANLTTTAKTNLVSAINELASSGSPVNVIDYNFGSYTPGEFDNIAKNNIRNTGLYLIRTTYQNMNAPVGIIYVTKKQSGWLYLNAVIMDYNNIYFSRRLQNASNGNPVDNNSYFSKNYKIISVANQSAQSFSNYAIPTGLDITNAYGATTKTSLNTTNKNGLVEAINEVNSQIGNINTVLATLTTPSNGGA